MLLVFILILFFIIIILSIKLKFYIRVKENKHYIFFNIYMLGRIKLYSNSIDTIKRKKISKVKSNKSPIDTEFFINLIKSKKCILEEFYLKMNVCTTDVIITSYVVAIVSSFIGIVTKLSHFKINSKKFYFKINPVYTNKKILNIKLKCIITVNLVHIICIFFRSKKDWRSDVNGRKSSNRKAYGNCNEQHKAND